MRKLIIGIALLCLLGSAFPQQRIQERKSYEQALAIAKASLPSKLTLSTIPDASQTQEIEIDEKSHSLLVRHRHSEFAGARVTEERIYFPDVAGGTLVWHPEMVQKLMSQQVVRISLSPRKGKKLFQRTVVGFHKGQTLPIKAVTLYVPVLSRTPQEMQNIFMALLSLSSITRH